MLFGGQTLRDFGFALLVGVASGTYSSIFIAAPVLVHWKEREPVWQRRERIVREDHGGIVPAYSEAALGDEAGRRSVVRRDRPARRAQAGSGTTATAAPPATTEVVPPDDGGDGTPGDGDSPAAAPRQDRPKPKSSGNRKRRRHGR
jgi:SecD/SecF fusion protein